MLLEQDPESEGKACSTAANQGRNEARDTESGIQETLHESGWNRIVQGLLKEDWKTQ